MLHKGKLFVFIGSALIVLYGISAAFYGKVVAKDDAYRELAVFMDALKKINEDYVEAPDMTKVQEGAFRGLIDALDPYSSFLTKEQVQALDKRKAAGTAGLGMVVSKRADVLYVVSTQHDGPAEAAGVRAGDYLVALDDASIEEKSILEVESLLRGAPDSTIKLTIFRNGQPKPVDINATRKPEVPSQVASQMLDGYIGLLQVSSLSGNSADQIRVRLKTLISAGAQKLILDLRDCADGETSNGVELANMFLKGGLIYYSQNGKGEKVQEVKAIQDKFLTDQPVAVLINGSTAGPAEIVAGALKDQKRGLVIGEKSFGVGSSQKQIALKSGALLILSTAKFYTPGGKMIQDETVRNTGIKPDVQAPDDDRRQDLLVESYYDDQNDAQKYHELQDKIRKEQLDKAVEALAKGQVPAKRAA
jgi:carboxyl-terminal processing protease